MSAVRSRRRARGQVALAALGVCAVLGLAACQGGDDAAGAPGGSPGAASTPATAPTPAPVPTGATAAPSAPSTKPPGKPAGKPGATATPAKKPGPTATAACDHTMPIAPDLISLYRYTPEGGDHNLIVKHGNWKCASPDGGGAPFAPVGTETFIPIAETAKITATAPIVPGLASKPVTLHELIAWVTAHPDSGLPFRYHLGAGGFIDTLDEVYVP
ncbi:hypothetical protein [Streptomyces sp. NPDC029003]|uniref:hypothetical protein n=1 Tax=Streptomyces sp. NPDC029003 TaxID=3155125 RepID=UPI0033E9D95B